ncbi:MAG: GNAT family N-acetyltransferase [Promethearchaeota archaeon]
MKIQKFSIDFYDEVIQLWRNTETSITSSDSKSEMERMLNRNPDLFLIGTLKDKVVAVVMGGFDGRRGYVHHLAIDPTYQRQGYGTKIMTKLNENFRQKGIQKVHLFVEKRNKEVIEFYRNLGWEIRDLTMMSFVPDEKLYKRKL